MSGWLPGRLSPTSTCPLSRPRAPAARFIRTAVQPPRSRNHPMTQYQAVDRVVDLLDPGKNILYNVTTEQARALLAEGDADAVRRLDGHFALVATRGQSVLLARS